MFEFVPLQVLDSFLLDYHLGHALVLGFVLSVLGAIPLKSTKILSLNVMAFGLIFVLAPTALTGSVVYYRLLGLALLVVGPMLYVFARR